jgi:DNA-directed RNA polymerase specialized sigma subunit
VLKRFKSQHFDEPCSTAQEFLDELPSPQSRSIEYVNLDTWTFNLPGIERISYRDEELLRIRLIEDLSQEEIACELGISTRTVQRRLQRIFSLLA